ncbi:hypothetical protein ACFKHW_17355 [Bradyrhizobium lupini]|uniref:hypothetical protein n=1 Tax=Rhizobium lupini TaxID=136996 RepID=UPI00367282D4
MTIERPMFPPRAESVDSFSPQPATGQLETGERTSGTPRPIASQSNVFTFPSARPASNVRELQNPSFDDDRARWRSPNYKSSGRPNMHSFVFRSYDLIVGSSEADLVRDVGLDVDKAETKLHCIQRQLQRDREHAATREDLLTRAEAKLSAAIAAVKAPPMPLALSDLGSAFERLLRRYVDESVKWHAAEGSSVAYDEANEEMCKISEQMEPLEDLIKKIDIDPRDPDGDAKLRTVALKDLRYKLPSMHDSWEITDGFGDDLEMFWQILEFVGLANFARETEQRIKAAVKS